MCDRDVVVAVAPFVRLVGPSRPVETRERVPRVHVPCVRRRRSPGRARAPLPHSPSFVRLRDRWLLVPARCVRTRPRERARWTREALKIYFFVRRARRLRRARARGGWRAAREVSGFAAYRATSPAAADAATRDARAGGARGGAHGWEEFLTDFSLAFRARSSLSAPTSRKRASPPGAPRTPPRIDSRGSALIGHLFGRARRSVTAAGARKAGKK